MCFPFQSHQLNPECRKQLAIILLLLLLAASRSIQPFAASWFTMNASFLGNLLGVVYGYCRKLKPQFRRSFLFLCQKSCRKSIVHNVCPTREILFAIRVVYTRQCAYLIRHSEPINRAKPQATGFLNSDRLAARSSQPLGSLFSQTAFENVAPSLNFLQISVSNFVSLW